MLYTVSKILEAQLQPLLTVAKIYCMSFVSGASKILNTVYI